MNIALILSGGAGERIGGDIPKQYREAGGKPMIAYVLERFAKHPEIDGIRVVAAPQWQEYIRRFLEEKFQGFSLPGKNRQLSILNGLEDMKKDASDEDVVLIHDAARPFVSERLITECLHGCRTHDGTLPALSMKDTVYLTACGKSSGESDKGKEKPGLRHGAEVNGRLPLEEERRIDSLLERERVVAGQAPEAFRFKPYYEANVRLLSEQILTIHGSTEPAILAGMDILVIPGEEENWKVTTEADLRRFQEQIERREDGDFERG